MSEGTFCRSTAAKFPLPAPKREARGGKGGKHAASPHDPIDPIGDGFSGFGGAPGQRRVYGGDTGGGMSGGLLKGMNGKKL